jgi:porin
VRLGFAEEKLTPIGRYVGCGLSYTGPFAGRHEDQAGVAVGVAKFGNPFRRRSALAGDPLNRREVIIEATYRAPLTSWLGVQPDVQVINPGGQRATADALIMGLRAGFQLGTTRAA